MGDPVAERAKARRNTLIGAGIAFAVLIWIMVASADQYDWTMVWLAIVFFAGVWAGRS